MSTRFATPEEVQRMFELAERPYRPKQIVELKEKIEGETRALELNVSVTGAIDQERVQRIVGMKLELDRLYGLWTTGEIE